MNCVVTQPRCEKFLFQVRTVSTVPPFVRCLRALLNRLAVDEEAAFRRAHGNKERCGGAGDGVVLRSEQVDHARHVV